MLNFRVHSAPWTDELWLLVVQEDHAAKVTAYAENMTMREHKAGDAIQEPTMRLHHTASQRLMDELWRAGVRPSNGEGNAGQLGAIEKHLEDMRRLVFKTQSAERVDE
jgi:hypothetical protein